MTRLWKKEFARDALALGSWVFFIAVLARALIGPYYDLLYQLLIAGALLILMGFFVRNYEGYLAKAVILGVFTTLFYNDLKFGVFAGILFLLMVWASLYLGNSRIKVIKGIGVGVLSTIIGYFLAFLI